MVSAACRSHDIIIRSNIQPRYCSQSHAPAPLPQGKAAGTHWKGGWVGPCAALDIVEKNNLLRLLRIELKYPAYSPSLYRLRSPEKYTQSAVLQISLHEYLLQNLQSLNCVKIRHLCLTPFL
jgi:hypothetical protein